MCFPIWQLYFFWKVNFCRICQTVAFHINIRLHFKAKNILLTVCLKVLWCQSYRRTCVKSRIIIRICVRILIPCERFLPSIIFIICKWTTPSCNYCANIWVLRVFLIPTSSGSKADPHSFVISFQCSFFSLKACVASLIACSVTCAWADWEECSVAFKVSWVLLPFGIKDGLWVISASPKWNF